MARLLAYVDAVPGRLYPLVPTLLELTRRGHELTVKAGADDIERLRSAGLDARPLAPPIERFEPDDWKARSRFGALMSGLRQFGERAPAQARDLTETIERERPDVLFIDEGAWGAAAAAECSGLPWAYSLVSAIPLTSRDAPPFGLGLRPRHDKLGQLRDRVARRLTLGSLERIVASKLNPLRAELGVPPFTTIDASYLAASLVIAYTAEPFEYPRSDWPDKVRLVGPGLWEPPAGAPSWLADIERPLVLVTCSTLFQNDRKLAEVACQALAGEPLDAAITTADIDPATLSPPANVRVERFLPHSPCSTAPPAPSATPAWASPRRRSLTAYRSSPFLSAATSPRSPAASRSPVPVSAFPPASSTLSGCAPPSNRPCNSRPGRNESPRRSRMRVDRQPPPTRSKDSLDRCLTPKRTSLRRTAPRCMVRCVATAGGGRSLQTYFSTEPERSPPVLSKGCSPSTP